jgi:hypothetical protein
MFTTRSRIARRTPAREVLAARQRSAPTTTIQNSWAVRDEGVAHRPDGTFGSAQKPWQPAVKLVSAWRAPLDAADVQCCRSETRSDPAEISEFGGSKNVPVG